MSTKTLNVDSLEYHSFLNHIDKLHEYIQELEGKLDDLTVDNTDMRERIKILRRDVIDRDMHIDNIHADFVQLDRIKDEQNKAIEELKG